MTEVLNIDIDSELTPPGRNHEHKKGNCENPSAIHPADEIINLRIIFTLPAHQDLRCVVNVLLFFLLLPEQLRLSKSPTSFFPFFRQRRPLKRNLSLPYSKPCPSAPPASHVSDSDCYSSSSYKKCNLHEIVNVESEASRCTASV